MAKQSQFSVDKVNQTTSDNFRTKTSQRKWWFSELRKALKSDRSLRQIAKPFLTMADRINTQTGLSAKMGHSAYSTAIDFITGTGSVLDRILRYKEYQLMKYQDTSCNNALNCYADNSVIMNPQTHHVIDVISQDEEIKEKLEDLLYGTFKVDRQARKWIKRMCLFGDHVIVLDININGDGISNWRDVRINQIDREDKWNPETKQVETRYYWKEGGLGNTTASMMRPIYGSLEFDRANMQSLEWYEVLHFSIDEEQDFEPFGMSKLEPARYVWRQLKLMEDAMMVYRIVRAPERRVFKIEVGNLEGEEQIKFIDDMLSEVKREAIADPTTGDINLQYNVANTLEDFVFPYRGGHGSDITTLPGGQNTDAIQDIEYFKSKLIAGLQVPKAFLTYDETLSTAKGLSKEDARFAANVGTIQQIFVDTLKKACITHLYACGFENERCSDFDLVMMNPSAEEERDRLETLQTKINLYNQATANGDTEPAMTIDFAKRFIFEFSDTEIAKMKTERLKDLKQNFIHKKITADGNYNNIFPNTPDEEESSKENVKQLSNDTTEDLGSDDFGGLSGGGGGDSFGGEDLGSELGEDSTTSDELSSVATPNAEENTTVDTGGLGEPIDLAAAERGELPIQTNEEENEPQLETSSKKIILPKKGQIINEPLILTTTTKINHSKKHNQQDFVNEVSKILKKINYKKKK